MGEGEGTHLSEAMQELSDLDVPEERRVPIKQPKATPNAEKVEPEGDEPETPEKNGEGEKATEPVKPVKAAELRNAYEKSKATLKERDAEITRLQSELKAAKDAPREDLEKATLTEKLTASEKRRQELENEVRFVNFKKSEEYTTKYEQPYQEAWNKAVSDITQLKVRIQNGTKEDPNTGETVPNYVSRVATPGDLLSLANLPLNEMDEKVEEAFGKSAPRVIRHIEKLRELADAQTAAEQKALKESGEKQQQTFEHRKQVKKVWDDENKLWAEKYPRFFKPEDGDEEGNALLAKGYELADLAFSGNGKKTPEDMAKLHAEVRNKVAGFGRLALRLKRARLEIKELKGSLAEYEKSEPPTGEGGRSRIKTTDGDLMGEAFAELDGLGKKSR
jgi:hypothetical protein